MIMLDECDYSYTIIYDKAALSSGYWIQGHNLDLIITNTKGALSTTLWHKEIEDIRLWLLDCTTMHNSNASSYCRC